MANRSWNKDYLQKQEEAIRWLAGQGISPVEIREMRWGSVDDGDKTLSVNTMVTVLQYDRDTGMVRRDEYEKKMKIPLLGTKCEWFFLRSKIPCAWMFTRERPKTWRKEGSKESIYSLSDVEKICGKLLSTPGTSKLTDSNIFDSIEVSNLNITKMKTKELEEAAVLVEK